MKKIGIVSELNLQNVNYGNRLQAFALNYYINNNLNLHADSLIFYKSMDKKITKNFLIGHLKKIIKNVLGFLPKNKNTSLSSRLNKCNNFTINNSNIDFINSKKDLDKKEYNYMIVGSDVVWAQFNNGVNRIKFLDFGKNSKFKKISYAASFGKNWIPDENKKYIFEQLKKFDFISVREKSSIDLLKSISIEDSVHVCDSTLLLSKAEWEKISLPIDNIPDKPYIFTYLLGKNKEQRDAIKKYARKKGYLIINIPNANMEISDIDNDFGDMNINDCSPEQWLWLINNSDLVITDSFHGCVFSNIFEKKYIILKREYSTDINIRMEDFLQSINEGNKFLNIFDFEKNIDNLKWNYDKINKSLDKLINNSKIFLEKALDIK